MGSNDKIYGGRLQGDIHNRGDDAILIFKVEAAIRKFRQQLRALLNKRKLSKLLLKEISKTHPALNFPGYIYMEIQVPLERTKVLCTPSHTFGRHSVIIHMSSLLYSLLPSVLESEGDRTDSISLLLSNHPPCFDLSINNRFSGKAFTVESGRLLQTPHSTGLWPTLQRNRSQC